MPTIVHFQIGADDPVAAAAFYGRVFGWKIEQAEDGSDYWYISTGDDEYPGIDGGLTHRFDDLNPTINTIDVPSLDLFAQKITEEGGKVLAPKVPLPGEGYLQYCEDPEGNIFGIVEYDAFDDDSAAATATATADATDAADDATA